MQKLAAAHAVLLTITIRYPGRGEAFFVPPPPVNGGLASTVLKYSANPLGGGGDVLSPALAGNQ